METKRLNANVPEDLHTNLKVTAALLKTSAAVLVIASLRYCLKSLKSGKLEFDGQDLIEK